MAEALELPSDIRERSVRCPSSGCSSISVEDILENNTCPTCGSAVRVKIVGDTVIPMNVVSGEGSVDVVEVPESPVARRDRFVEEDNLGFETADKLTTDIRVADFYEEVTESTDPETAATFIADTLLGELNYRDMDISDVEPDEVLSLVDALSNDNVTWRAATEEVVRVALDESRRIDEVFESKDVGKTSSDELISIVEELVEQETQAVEDYKSGADEALNHIVGQVMKETDGKADAQEARRLIEEEIESS